MPDLPHSPGFLQKHVVETFFGFDEESVDSETLSETSCTTDKTDRAPVTPEEDVDDVSLRHVGLALSATHVVQETWHPPGPGNITDGVAALGSSSSSPLCAHDYIHGHCTCTHTCHRTYT